MYMPNFLGKENVKDANPDIPKSSWKSVSEMYLSKLELYTTVIVGKLAKMHSTRRSLLAASGGWDAVKNM
ncbi:hypothetical protein AAMO2058_000956100 [Amorphochlora amoebiformis]